MLITCIFWETANGDFASTSFFPPRRGLMNLVEGLSLSEIFTELIVLAALAAAAAESPCKLQTRNMWVMTGEAWK
jgi:hypothetical protein